MSFLLNHNYRFFIEVTPVIGGPVEKLRIAKGIISVDPDNNEESDETYYYDGGGAAERDVIGFMLSYAFEGHRNYGDPAQDYIMDLATKTGPDRKVKFIVEEPGGTSLEGPATISDIGLPGGDANAKGDISFTISFDGSPVVVEPPIDEPFPPLATPLNLAAPTQTITQTEAIVNWEHVAPVGTVEKVEYDVFVDGTLKQTVAVKTATIADLVADTTYSITVQAKYVNKPETKSLVSDALSVKTLA